MGDGLFLSTLTYYGVFVQFITVFIVNVLFHSEPLSEPWKDFAVSLIALTEAYLSVFEQIFPFYLVSSTQAVQ